jgi:gluconate 5-dehydrogenase
MDAFRLDGQVALITGGGTGLGLGIAKCLADAGAKVVLTGRREDVLQKAAAEIGSAAHVEVHDVTQFDEAPALVQRVTETVGPITTLINNAGNRRQKPMIDTTEEEFMTVFNTHFMGAYALTRAVAPGMIDRKSGSIIFIASMTSFMGMPEVIGYTTSKTAYLGMVRTLTAEFSPYDVRVNAIAPGWIKTPMTKISVDGDPPRKEKILARTPMHRMGDPEDIGHAATYLCSPAARFVTGTCLIVDGGVSSVF